MNENLLLLIVGLVVTSIGLFKYRQRILYRQTGIQVEGHVIDLISTRGGYFPVISFKTLTGSEITERYSAGSRPAAYQRGELVQVMYLEENPKFFILAGKKSANREMLWLVLGILICLTAIYLLFFHTKP